MHDEVACAASIATSPVNHAVLAADIALFGSNPIAVQPKVIPSLTPLAAFAADSKN